MPQFLNTLDLTNIGIQGQRVYARLRGVPGSKWVDMGNVEDLAPTTNSDTNQLTTARNGVRVPAKTLTTSVTDTFGFDTLDTTDPTIRGLWNGVAAVPVVGADGAQGMVRTPGGKYEAELAVLEPGAPDTDSALTYFPRVELAGNGKRASGGTEAGRLSFLATILADEGYTVPATVDASTPKAPNGYDVVVEASSDPVGDLHAILDLLAAPYDADGGAATP